MRITRSVLLKSLVKPFYRRHAALFAILFVILFGVVAVLKGTGFSDYHLSLMPGLLKNPFLYLLVSFIWLLYAMNAEQFIANILRSPDHRFLKILVLLDSRKLYLMIVWIQLLLLLPIILFLILIFAAGIYLHIYSGCIFILLYFISLVLFYARWQLYKIQNPDKKY
jgi:hypothetical protein